MKNNGKVNYDNIAEMCIRSRVHTEEAYVVWAMKNFDIDSEDIALCPITYNYVVDFLEELKIEVNTPQDLPIVLDYVEEMLLVTGGKPNK